MNAETLRTPGILQAVRLARVEPANAEDEMADDWERLVEAWEALGYGDAPPRCMRAYVEEVLAALR